MLKQYIYQPYIKDHDQNINMLHELLSTHLIVPTHA
jgi:hypothetical protein